MPPTVAWAYAGRNNLERPEPSALTPLGTLMASDPWESSLPQEDRKPNSAQPSRLDKAAGGDWRDQSGFIRPHPTAILRAALGVFLAVGAVGLLVLMCSFPFPDLMFVPL